MGNICVNFFNWHPFSMSGAIVFTGFLWLSLDDVDLFNAPLAPSSRVLWSPTSASTFIILDSLILVDISANEIGQWRRYWICDVSDTPAGALIWLIEAFYMHSLFPCVLIDTCYWRWQEERKRRLKSNNFCHCHTYRLRKNGLFLNVCNSRVYDDAERRSTYKMLSTVLYQESERCC